MSKDIMHGDFQELFMSLGLQDFPETIKHANYVVKLDESKIYYQGKPQGIHLFCRGSLLFRNFDLMKSP